MAFDKAAEIISKHLVKGAQLYVEGKQKTNKWEDKDGNKRSTPEIIVREFSFIGSKGETSEVPQGGAPQQDDDFNSDIPF